MSLSIGQIKFLRALLKIILIGPLVYWFVLGFQGNLGAEPIVRVNTQSGYVVLFLLLFNLLLGIMLAFSKKWPPWWRWIFAERRAIGIASGLYAILHIFSYFGKEAFQSKAFEQLLTKTYLTVGFLAFLILMILLLTSNNISVKKLGIKKWKSLHRIVYLAGALIMAHVFLIEKANLALLALMILPIAALEIFRAAKWIYRKRFQKLKE